MPETGPAYPAIYRLVWKVDGGDPQRCVVELAGVVNEYFDYGDLLFALSPPPGQKRTEVVLDCAGITRMNSEGVARWVRFITVLSRYDLAVTYRRCSPAVVTQLNQVPESLGAARVESVLAPYRCKETQQEELRLIELGALTDLTRAPRFQDERGTWELDDQPRNYFAFARQ